MNLKVSIIVPCYQVEETLQETIDAVLRQTYDQWELLLVDDASSDGTAEILEAAENGPFGEQIKVIRNSVNQGLGATRNCGLENARGEFIAFLDADDYWNETYLEEGVSQFGRADPADLIYSQITTFGDCDDEAQQGYVQKPKRFAGDFMKQIFTRCFFIPSAVMMRREVYERVGGFRNNRKLQGTEDHEYWIRCLDAGFKFGENPGGVCFYRRHEKSMTINENAISYSWKRLSHRWSLLRYGVIPLWLRLAVIAAAFIRLGQAYLTALKTRFLKRDCPPGVDS